MRDNVRAFSRWQFRPRHGVEVTESRSVRHRDGAEAGLARACRADRLQRADAQGRRTRHRARRRPRPASAASSPPFPARAGGCGGDRRQAVHADLSSGRAARRARRPWRGRGGGRQRSVPHHRHAGGGPARARFPQRHEPASGARCLRQAALSARCPGPSRLGGGLSDGREHARLAQCGGAGRRTVAHDRCRQDLVAFGGDLGGSQMDPRAVERPHRHQGRADGGGCAPRRGWRRRCGGGVQPWRAPARRRRRGPGRLARSGARGRQRNAKC